MQTIFQIYFVAYWSTIENKTKFTFVRILRAVYTSDMDTTIYN